MTNLLILQSFDKNSASPQDYSEVLAFLIKAINTIIKPTEHPVEEMYSEEEKSLLFSALKEKLNVKEKKYDEGLLFVAQNNEALFSELLDLLEALAKNKEGTHLPDLLQALSSPRSSYLFSLQMEKPELYIRLYKLYHNRLAQSEFRELIPDKEDLTLNDFKNVTSLFNLMEGESKDVQYELLYRLFNALENETEEGLSGFYALALLSPDGFIKMLEIISQLDLDHERQLMTRLLRSISPLPNNPVISLKLIELNKKFQSDLPEIDVEKNYNQSHFLKSIIQYMKLKDPQISEDTIKNLNEGLCLGLSTIMSEMHAHHKENWWIHLYKAIIDWGQTPIVIDKKIHTLIETQAFLDEVDPNLFNNIKEAGESTYQSREVLIERAISYVLYSQLSKEFFQAQDNLDHLLLKKENDPASKSEYLLENNQIESVENVDNIHLKLTDSNNDLALFLKSNLKMGQRCIITYSNGSSGHALSILKKEDHQGTAYGLYDPNETSGEPIWFEDLDDLFQKANELIKLFIPNHDPFIQFCLWSKDKNNPVSFQDFFSSLEGLPIFLNSTYPNEHQEKEEAILSTILSELENPEILSKKWLPALTQDYTNQLLLALTHPSNSETVILSNKKLTLLIRIIELTFHQHPEYLNQGLTSSFIQIISSHQASQHLIEPLLVHFSLQLQDSINSNFPSNLPLEKCTCFCDLIDEALKKGPLSEATLKSVSYCLNHIIFAKASTAEIEQIKERAQSLRDTLDKAYLSLSEQKNVEPVKRRSILRNLGLFSVNDSRDAAQASQPKQSKQ